MKKILILLILVGTINIIQAQVTFVSSSSDVCLKEKLDKEFKVCVPTYFDVLFTLPSEENMITVNSEKGKYTYYVQEREVANDKEVYFYFCVDTKGERIAFIINLEDQTITTIQQTYELITRVTYNIDRAF